MIATEPTSNSSPDSDVSESNLNALEIEVIEMVVGALRILGLPRSLGEIYGLLFLSPKPLTLDDLVSRLRISKGSGSQGLKTLRQIGAVKQSYVPGDRRDFYIAEIELKKLVSGFLGGQLVPHLENGTDRLAGLKGRAKELSPRCSKEEEDFYEKRIQKLGQWVKRAKQLAPLVSKFID